MSTLSTPQRTRVPFDVSFLTNFTYSSVNVSFRPVSEGTLPLFFGTSLRGALGYRIPLRHPLHAIYGRDDDIRPLILAPRLPALWDPIVNGGPVIPPFFVEPSTDGRKLPILTIPNFVLEPDCRLHVRFTLLGRYARESGDLLRFLACKPLQVDRALLEVVEARDLAASGRVLWADGCPTGSEAKICTFEIPAELARRPIPRLRVLLLAPICRHVEGAGDGFAAPEFFAAALKRSIALYDAFQKADGTRSPWMELPRELPHIAGRRLYRHYFDRISHSQQRTMSFGGLVGCFDLVGNNSALLPLLLAAELLHIGQKSSVGFGQIQCLPGSA